jgi:hypothetical protein
MAVLMSTDIPIDWSEIPEPEPLTDEQAQRFLVAFEECEGKAKAAFRRVDVDKRAVLYARRVDERFRDRWDEIRRRHNPLCRAGDELFWALDAMDDLVGGDAALDHLINVAFDPTEEPVDHIEVELGEVDADVLVAARDRVARAGFEWAVEVVRATGYLDREVKASLERKLAKRQEINQRKRLKREASEREAGEVPS